MTVEHALATLWDVGCIIRIDGDALVVEAPSPEVAARIPPEALDTIRAHRDEARRIVARMQARGFPRFTFRCVVCDARFHEDDLGPGGWLPTPDGAWWPRCPGCATQGRTPTPVTPPSPRRRGAR